MLWLLLAIAAGILFLQTVRWAQHGRGSLAWTFFVNYALAAAFYLPLYQAAPGNDSALVLLLGGLVGVMYVVNLYLIAAVIRTSGLALTSATATMAVVVPVLVSIIGGDPWVDKTPGLVIALMAAPMLLIARSDLNGQRSTESGMKKASWMILLFAVLGIEMSCFKVARNIGAEGFERVFLPALFTAAMLTSLPPALAAGVRACGRADLLRGVLLGALNIISSYAFAMALIGLAGTVAFPVRHIGLVTGATVLGYVLWRERVNRIGLAGIALGLTAAVLLSA